jgi:hypothetical protein
MARRGPWGILKAYLSEAERGWEKKGSMAETAKSAW